MSTTFIVTASHVSTTYTLSNETVTVHQSHDGFYCSIPLFGCGKTYPTAVDAINGLLDSNGCFDIVVMQPTPVQQQQAEASVQASIVAPAARTAGKGPKTARTYSPAGQAKRAAAAAARKAAEAKPAPLFSLANCTTTLPALVPNVSGADYTAFVPAPVDPMVAAFGPRVTTSAPAAAPAVGKLPNGLPTLALQAVTSHAAQIIAYLRDYASRNTGTGTGWNHLHTLSDGYLAAVVGNCPTERAARRRMRAWLAPVASKHGGIQPAGAVA